MGLKIPHGHQILARELGPFIGLFQVHGGNPADYLHDESDRGIPSADPKIHQNQGVIYERKRLV